jgi:hypothetical protein
MSSDTGIGGREQAIAQDLSDNLKFTRNEFHIPSLNEIKSNDLGMT